MVDIARYKLTITTSEKLLGTAPLNQEIYTTYIESKKFEHQKRRGDLPKEVLEEKEAEDIENLEKTMTGFRQESEEGPNKNKFYMYNYQIMGLIKESALTLNGGSSNGRKLPLALKSKITNQVRILPRKIFLPFVDADLVDTPVGRRPQVFERPLRAQTAQGPRTALAKSEYLPENRTFECELLLATGVASKTAIKEADLRAVLDYATIFSGIGQWRNGDFGKFTYTLEEV